MRGSCRAFQAQSRNLNATNIFSTASMSFEVDNRFQVMGLREKIH